MTGETTPLTGGSGGRSGGGSNRNSGPFRFSIITLAALSAALIAVTITFQLKLRSLSTQLTSEKSHLTELQTKVDDQQTVIDRFSNSVSNKDVMEKVSDLEDDLRKTEKELSHKLFATQQSIEDLLNATLTKLDTTVKMAQDEIQEEVDKVKHDVNDYVIQTQDQFSMENSFMVYQLAGTFTLLASLISMWHMTAHLRRFNQPFVQRKILAILWMSPLYGLTSWLSLVMPAYEGYLAVIKDFYEAYVIYQFLSLCIAILGKGDRDSVVDLLAQHADHLKPPFRLCGCCRPNPYRSPREMAEAVLIQCQTFTMQFVFLRPLTTIGIFVCNKVGYYGWGTSASDYRSPQFWLNMIQNLSVFIAFSGLLKFYHAVQEDLAWCRPFPKFLCIKGIVFLTFWQGLAIAILAETIGDTTPNVGNSDPELWAKQAQNFLICLEMLLFSIAHFYCFPTDEWEDGYRPVVSDSKFGDQLALHDFFQDLKLVARQGKKKKKKKTEELRMWMARRSRSKSKYPGMLDHIVAGGQPAGMSLLDNVVKECEEEAGVPPELTREVVRAAGAVSYESYQPYEGDDEVIDGVISRSLLFCYDMELPSDFTPVVVDGEVDHFFQATIDEVKAMMDPEFDDPIKPNCYPVIIDYLLRAGHISPDSTGYLDVLRTLRSGYCG
mmetsp:Transcript_37316/g.81805  ORF Transcript_37316/g.81805 Transcript_37316/m.81805 type:complete len:663 (-) Transcript_37316:2911-4899(-)